MVQPPAQVKKAAQGQEVPCDQAICAEPEFKSIKIEHTISPSLLKPPSDAYRVGPGDELDIEIAEESGTQAIAVQEGLAAFGNAGSTGVTITAGN